MTEHTHTPGAVRAAAGVVTRINSGQMPKEFFACCMAAAAIIDRETAAPEMLRALRALVGRLDNMTTTEFGHGGDRAEREAARAAIEQAGGGGE